MSNGQCDLVLVGFDESTGSYRHTCRMCDRERMSRYSDPSKIHRKCTSDSSPASLGWGDRLGMALAKIGITDESVSAWVGAPCNCPERRERLNRLGRWVTGILAGGQSEADAAATELTSEVSGLP